MSVARQDLALQPVQPLDWRPRGDMRDLESDSLKIVADHRSELVESCRRREARERRHGHARQIHGAREVRITIGRDELAAEADTRGRHEPATGWSGNLCLVSRK
jgi:hypothetical protein